MLDNCAALSAVAVRFLLEAEPSPGLLPRLLQPFAKRDLTPDRMSALRIAGVLQIEIAMDAMPAEVVNLVEGNLRQIVGVVRIAREHPADLVLAA